MEDGLIIDEQLNIYNLNVEGISIAKSEIITKEAMEMKAMIITLQETHSKSDKDLLRRGNIEGYNLCCSLHSPIHGIATYVKNTIDNVEVIENAVIDGVFTNVIKVQGITIVNLYKPPPVLWNLNSMKIYNEPCIYIGDMNSHHTSWGYRSNDQNGELLMNWSYDNGLELIYDAKDRKSFFSKIHRTETNPDLCFVTRDLFSNDKIKRKVLSDFPHSQHRPIYYKIGISIHVVQSLQKPRYNFMKADWTAFANEMDHIIQFIPPIVKNYDRFVQVTHKIAKKHIPRGFRKNYIPGWNDECNKLYDEFKESNDQNKANELIDLLNRTRKENWIKLTENTNMTKTSRKAWSFVRKMGNAALNKTTKTKVKANEVASRLINITKVISDKQATKKLKKENQQRMKSLPSNSEFSRNFSMEELEFAITQMKNGKAPGYDGIFMEFIKNFKNKTRTWLLQLFNHILLTGTLPKQFKRSKIIAIVKPGKTGSNANEFRPITLLSIVFKLFERLILNRVEPIMDNLIPIEQAAFRKQRGSVEQVLALTTFIENGFQEGLKTFTCFIDMTAAYDTVWCDRLLSKFMNAIPCKKLTIILKNILCNRMFCVHMNDDNSRWRRINNGLVQGSVLSPILFNLYTNDDLKLQSRRFIFADDWAIAIQCKSFEEAQEILEKDLKIIHEYFENSRLRMNPSKSEVCAFHLNNKEAKRELVVRLNGNILKHNFSPKYLGIVLDRSLTYKEHISKLTMKVRSRVNIIQKLAGTNWGADPDTLRISTYGLVISTSDYGAPIWFNSSHVNKIDTQVNSALRIISGTVKATSLPWLHVLSNIPPHELRRRNVMKKLVDTCMTNENSLLYEMIENKVPQRLNSRKPIWQYIEELRLFDLISEWKVAWSLNQVVNKILIQDPSKKVPGYNLDRKSWKNLNRIRTDQGRCNYCLFKWNVINSPLCDCNLNIDQTITHILSICPIRKFTGTIEELHFLNTTRAIDYLKNMNIDL